MSSRCLPLKRPTALVQRNKRLVVLMSMPSFVSALPAGSSAIFSFSTLSDGEWRGETMLCLEQERNTVQVKNFF